MSTAMQITDNLNSDFADPSADVLLVAKDDIKFRVHSVVLKRTSGWFREMFKLPQDGNDDAAQVVLHVDETSDVLDVLLAMITGLPIPGLVSIDFVERLLSAAEKYDMPGPISIIRLLILSPPFITLPLCVYKIASGMGWVEEAKIASSHTLTLDLCNPTSLEQIGGMDGRALAELMVLHRRRRECLAEGLDSDTFIANVSPRPCTYCGKPVHHTAWHTMKYMWMNDIERRPFGSALTAEDIVKRPEVLDVLDAVCPNCNRYLYNQLATLSNLVSIIDGLPKTVDF
ncbi:hypothetical protein AcW1_000544 [Taiwanofungus camphoratus]|nr:hypothetical protein AcV7_000562 [Antrodia cinnamomea]KAI0963479.1 hypothetical protein AcW1_000544 [Antrodia cinnamomea]